MATKTIKPLALKACYYYTISELVPEAWSSWFWEAFSANAPFSWGDNDRTLVRADRVLRHVKSFQDLVLEDGLCTEEEFDSLVELIECLGESYVDLEN